MTCDLDDQPVCVDSGDMRDEKAGLRVRACGDANNHLYRFLRA